MSSPNRLPNLPIKKSQSKEDNNLSSHIPNYSNSPGRSIISQRSELSGSFKQSEIAVEDPNLPTSLSEATASKVIKNYLVTGEELSSRDSQYSSDDNASDVNVYSASHTLQGGAITRDIYKWQEDRVASRQARRSLSFHGLRQTSSIQDGDDFNTDSEYQVGDILQPGGFRRHFVHQRAILQGREPNMVTRTFIDFLALYGHFAGEDYPSDEDDDTDDSLLIEGGISPNTRLVNFREDMAPREEDPDESTPLQPKVKITNIATSSSQKCFFLLMKSFVGTGVLFLPRSFYNGGMIFSSIMLLLVAFLSLYCMLLLVECSHLKGGSFGEIGRQLYGPYARNAVMGSIVLSQLGFCCAYTIFVAKNLRELVITVTNCQVNLSEATYIFGQLLIYIPMAMVRKIKYFSMAALIADVFILAGIGYLYYFDIEKLLTVGMAKITYFNHETFALMIGTAIFTFEGIGLVLPIAESMKEPAKFPRVLSWTVALSAGIFVSVAALCYATFGEKVDSVVLLNLPRENTTVQGVQLLYSLAIIFSVPLQLFPAIRIFESFLFTRRSGKQHSYVKWQKNLFRTGLSFFFASVAYFGAASLDNFVSLIGAFACVPLCFIYPALFHWKAIQTATPAQIANSPVPISNGKWQPVKDLILCFFGAVMMVYVTYITLNTWNKPEVPIPDYCQ